MSDRGSGLPDDERRAWDAIVADLSGELDLPGFPAEPDLDDDDEIDGFEPPPPPPLPRPQDRLDRFTWAALIGGPALVVLTNLLGWESWIAGIGVIATIGGFVGLVARMKERDEDDDGAIV